MTDTDLAVVTTHAELVARLDRLYIRADSPSYRDLEQRTGRLSGSSLPTTGLKRVRLGRSAIGELLRGSMFPKKAFLLTFVEACGVDVAADSQWAEAWDRLSEQYAKRGGQAQTELAQLRAEVARLHEEVAAEQFVVDGLRAKEVDLRAEAARLRAEMKAQAEQADRHAEAVRLRAEEDLEKAEAEKADLRAQLATATKAAAEARAKAIRAEARAKAVRAAEVSRARQEAATEAPPRQRKSLRWGKTHDEDKSLRDHDKDESLEDVADILRRHGIT